MTTGIKCRRAPPAWFSRVFSRLPPLFALLYLTDTLAALRKKNRPTGHLKSTGFEKYGVALGILALRIFRRGRTWPYVCKEKVVVCKLKQSAPFRVDNYGSHPLNSRSRFSTDPVFFKCGVRFLMLLNFGRCNRCNRQPPNTFRQAAENIGRVPAVYRQFRQVSSILPTVSAGVLPKSICKLRAP